MRSHRTWLINVARKKLEVVETNFCIFFFHLFLSKGCICRQASARRETQSIMSMSFLTPGSFRIKKKISSQTMNHLQKRNIVWCAHILLMDTFPKDIVLTHAFQMGTFPACTSLVYSQQMDTFVVDPFVVLLMAFYHHSRQKEIG